jgi:D-alanine-D-alanine ligase
VKISQLKEISNLSDPKIKKLLELEKNKTDLKLVDFNNLKKEIGFAFLMTHGDFGEDGKIQGLLDSFEIPYSGSGVSSSAVCMDKIFAKEILSSNSIPVTPYIKILNNITFEEDAKKLTELKYPLFVKPANAGSSVGISKIYSPAELKAAFKKASKYDSRILIEEGISAREIEVGILEDKNGKGKTLKVSALGEIIANDDFYGFESKYKSEKTVLQIPAKLDKATEANIENLALRIFKLLDCKGFARIDFFIDKNTGKIYFNEINTLPGFTQKSMYPLLFKEKGISYSDLVEKLINK